MAGHGIDQLIYSLDGEAIFRTCLIQIGVVDAHPPFATHLLGKNHVRAPFRVSHFPYKLGIKELLYFLIDSSIPF